MSEAGEVTTEAIKEPSVQEVLVSLDRAVEGKPGIKPSDAWGYRETVRAKYGLPESGYRWNDPSHYIATIERLLKERGIAVGNKHEFQRFFDAEENTGAGAVAFGSNVFRDTTVVAEAASGSDWYALRARANELAHESVHGLQDRQYPRMPDYEAEREAYYYQMLTPERIIQSIDDPEYFHYWLNEVMEANIRSSTTINSATGSPDNKK